LLNLALSSQKYFHCAWIPSTLHVGLNDGKVRRESDREHDFGQGVKRRDTLGAYVSWGVGDAIDT